MAPSNVSLHELKAARLSSLPLLLLPDTFSFPPVSHSLRCLQVKVTLRGRDTSGTDRINAHPGQEEENR